MVRAPYRLLGAFIYGYEAIFCEKMLSGLIKSGNGQDDIFARIVNFFKFALYSIILVPIPGPDLTFFNSRSILHGAKAGFAGLLGAYSGIFIYVIAVPIGLSALIIASPMAFFC